MPQTVKWGGMSIAIDVGYDGLGKAGVKAPVSKRRSNIEIIADILRTGEHGAGKTEIMYSANMSYTQTQRYLNFLLEKEFLQKIKLGGTLTAYRVTDAGQGLLKTIDTLISMLSNQEE